MEMSRTDDNMRHGYAKIVGGMVIGKTENTEDALDLRSPFGVRTPRTEYFEMSGTKFFNYNWNEAAAFMTCSHCWHDANTDSGGRTMTVSDLYLDPATVQKTVLYSTPKQTIFRDLDGTMTGKGPNSWLLPPNKHLLVDSCELKESTNGIEDASSIVCDNTYEARRIAFHGMPKNFFGMILKILPLSEADETAKRNDGTY